MVPLRGDGAQRQGLPAQARCATKQDDSTATVIFDLSKLGGADQNADERKDSNKAHYIWDLTFDTTGRLYIATGGPGAVYRIDPPSRATNPNSFSSRDEAHIRSLAWDSKRQSDRRVRWLGTGVPHQP